MAGKRRVCGALFKAEVALAATKRDRTMAQLVSQLGIHASHVTARKKQLIGRSVQKPLANRERRDGYPRQVGATRFERATSTSRT